ncbi:MAG: flippase-like domain-containing protein [Bacteroidetes bacterium]|nr:flippase-like domain-containing protein [Bacteroidota bacterium]
MKKYIRLIGLFILLIILLRIDFSQLIDILFHVNILHLLLAIVLNIPHLFFKSYRWNLLLKQQRITYSPVQSFLVYMSSLYVGFMTPGRFGEFVKTLYLKSDKGISLSKGFSSVLVDRLFDLYLLIILGFIGIRQFGILGKLSEASLILTIIVVLTPLIMLNKQLMGKFTNILYKVAVVKKVKGKIKESFEDFYSGLNQLINPRLLVSGLLTCLGYFIFFVQCYLIVLAMGLSINFITITLFMAISNLVSFIPISISGLGTRDAILIYFFYLIGLELELAVSYAFLVFITFFVCSGLMGAVAWWIKPVSFVRAGLTK